MASSIIIAVILIVTGLLVWKYPRLIAGYNTMTPEQQRNVDIKGLKAFMCRAFCLMGIAVILAAYLFRQFINGIAADLMATILIPLSGTVCILIGAQRYDHNQKKRS